MAHTVVDRDLRTLVDVIEQARLESPPVGLPRAVLELVHSLVACDIVSFTEIAPIPRLTYLAQEGPTDPIVRSEDVDFGDEPFWQHYWDSEACSYPSRSGDERTITSTSDFYSQRQWHATGMYQDYLLGFEHEAMMCLSAPDGRTRRLIFFRTTDHDFDERERLLLALLRPHLNEAYQDLQRRRAAGPTLTQQQRRVLRLVADGLSNKEIARELVVSATTVRTHLEKIFVTLDVTSRGAAVAKAFPRPPF